MKKLVFIFFIGITVSACSSQKKTQDVAMVESYIKIAETKYPDKSVQYLPNADSTLMLCFNEVKGSAQNPRNRIEFMVVELKTGNTLHESNLSGGNIKWYNNESLEIFRIPGIMAQGQTTDDYTEILNVRTKSSVQKSSFSKQ